MPAKASIRTADAPMNNSPSQDIVNSASELKYETDSRGRKIGITKPRALLRIQLMRLLGPENSKNEVLMGNSMLAYIVRSIDNTPVPLPNSERQLDALIDRLDDDGLVAVGKCLIEQFGVASPNDGDVDEAIKKLIRDSELNEVLWLVKNGVPYDVAFSLPTEERFAFAVIFGIFEGNKFDFDKMQWIKESIGNSMTKELSILEFCALATEMVVEFDHAKHKALEAACKIIEKESKRVIGTYDYGWPELCEATQAERESLGFEPDEPLLRTGALRDSIEHTLLSDNEAEVGSNNQIAVYQELGTATIPARSFLAGAAAAKGDEVAKVMGDATVEVLLEGRSIGKMLDVLIEGQTQGRVDVGSRLAAIPPP